MVELTATTLKAVNIAILAFGSLGAFIVLLNFPRQIRKNRTSNAFYLCTLAIAISMACYTVSLLLSGGDGTLSIIFRAVSYVGVFLVYYTYITYIIEHVELRDEFKVPVIIRNISLVVAAIGSILWILSIFDPDFAPIAGDFCLGRLGDLVMAGIAIALLIYYREALEKQQLMIMASMPVLAVIANIFESTIAQGMELRYPAIALAFMLIYTQHHLDVETRFEIEEAENTKNRISMAAGRMKPHYLYNVLTSIYYLCESDPKQAQYAIGTFSEYLRNTLEAMERRELVDFSWELSVIKNYLTLERLRFGERIKVKYDIEVEDFMIPPLSIQPLVENAVKHGLAPKEEGGTVNIVTRRLSDGGVQIRIIDDGIGFNVEQLKIQDVTHEGVANVRERIRLDVNGDMTITSVPGKGTTSTVTIR